MPDSLQLCGLQHTRLLWPLLSCRVCSKLNPLSRWCYLTISSSANSFSFAFLFPRIRILSNEYLGLITLRIDWFDLLTVHGNLKSLLQHHNSKASVLWCSSFFMVQLSPLLMITEKTIALTIRDLCQHNDISTF